MNAFTHPWVSALVKMHAKEKENMSSRKLCGPASVTLSCGASNSAFVLAAGVNPSLGARIDMKLRTLAHISIQQPQ